MCLLPQQVSVVMNAGAAPSTYQLAWTKNTLADQWQHLKEYLVSWQGYFFNDRLVTTAGTRHTANEAFTRTTATDGAGNLYLPNVAANYESSSFDRISYGFVAKATPWLSGYYNYSENGRIPGTSAKLIPDNRLKPLHAGKGRDFGLMFNLLDNRLSARFGYFTPNSVNQSVTSGSYLNVGNRNDSINQALIAAGRPPANTVTIEGGNDDLADVDAHGYELNLTANLTPSWRMIVNASKSKVVTSNMLKAARSVAAVVVPTWTGLSAADQAISTGSISIAQEIANYQSWLAATTAVEGESTIGQRELEFRLFTRYDFRTGPIKGVYTGGGLRYGSSPVVGKSTAGAYFSSPANREVDLLLGYRTDLGLHLRKIRLDLQFNAQSILHQEDYTYLQIQANGQPSRVQVNAPPRYSLSATFSF